MVSTKLLPPVDITMATTTTNNSSGRTTTLQKWKQQLVTQDDAFHHHKILGSLVLGILIWRFMGILVGSPPQSSATRNSSNSCDLRFLSHPEWTWPTLAIHFALNLSSFQFQIPQRRIQDGGRICKLIFCSVFQGVSWCRIRHSRAHTKNFIAGRLNNQLTMH